ncbi:MAG TPA: FlgD immunoglobulin-like domain containing protein, partial [Candidatus Eisenbacteria bacterium]|nr:FlgD immunoglobulin-like domain containing protein [Candidatus Eisenbacteria bacterium]
PAPKVARVQLRQNYPNPFNPRTTIRYTLARPGRVALRVFDVTGRLVATLRDDVEPAGDREVEWDGRDRAGRTVASGVYIYRLSTESGENASRRMAVVK